MNVTINGVSYEGIWDTDTFTMETNMTLAQIEEAFVPGANKNIIVEENDQEIARYYNKGLTSIEVFGSSPRTIRANFDLTQIDENAETRIISSLEDSDGAIVELAEIVSELSNIDTDDIYSKLQSNQETINTWFASASEIMQFINDLRMDGGILSTFDRRITALEQAIIDIQPSEQSEEPANKEENNDG